MEEMIYGQRAEVGSRARRGDLSDPKNFASFSFVKGQPLDEL